MTTRQRLPERSNCKLSCNCIKSGRMRSLMLVHSLALGRTRGKSPGGLGEEAIEEDESMTQEESEWIAPEWLATAVRRGPSSSSVSVTDFEPQRISLTIPSCQPIRQ